MNKEAIPTNGWKIVMMRFGIEDADYWASCPTRNTMC